MSDGGPRGGTRLMRHGRLAAAPSPRPSSEVLALFDVGRAARDTSVLSRTQR